MKLVVLAHLAVAFAPLITFLLKLGVEDINSDFDALIQTAVVLVALSVLVGATGKFQSLRSVGPGTWVFLILSELATSVSWLCHSRAMHLGEASRVAPADNLSVVFGAPIAAVLLGERLSAMGWLGAGLIAASAVLVAAAP
ncbi:EamA family transporter [Leisingera daeponensis]|uniref:EamA family transporter n=1 Tax=Leisingera daeponensis TaxID=405746 RepID=A0ABS7NEP0_9RHOB|nr:MULTISPECIES: EamA family transporter [Leisingera]MBY6139331.1 EamA family transporter [Leisingera daeponensis]